jgi:homoserine dehydrogenase
VELRVHPTLVPDQQLLASVSGVMNAVLVHGNAAGDTLYYGAGAGALPTASSVVADLIDLARGQAMPPDACRQRDDRPVAAIDAVETGFYLRIPSLDKPGVFAQVATILSQQDISIEAAIQKEQVDQFDDQQPWVPIIILTEDILESKVRRAIEAVQRLPQVVGTIRCIRVEHFRGG